MNTPLLSLMASLVLAMSIAGCQDRGTDAAPPAPFALIGRAKRELGLPVAAIGGITLERAPQVLAAGADLLAVVGNVFGAADPAARARAYGTLFRAP